MTNLTFGCDPEFFLFDTYRGQYISAHDFVPGTKHEPHKLHDGAVQVDGTAVEFNIDPVTNPKDFTSKVVSVMSQIRGMIPVHLEFHFVPVVNFNPLYWMTVPEASKELGCDPDFDANFDGRENPRPGGNVARRTGGGHLHVGWTDGKSTQDDMHRMDCISYVKNLHNHMKEFKKLYDADQIRGSMYGYNAAFRPKSYGAEYRAPSNVWIKYPKLHEWFLDTASRVFDTLEKGEVRYRNDPAYRFGIKCVPFPKDYADTEIKY